jgi:hypothetical protein
VYGKWPPDPFQGSIQDKQFKIELTRGPHRPGRGRGYKSISPVIIGNVVPVPTGSEVRVLMRIPKDAAVVLAVMLAGLLSMAAVAIWNAATVHGAGAAACKQLAIAGGLAVLLYAAWTISFQSEVKKARKLMCAELRCREVG